MNKPMLYRLGARAVLGSSVAFVVACSGAGGEIPPSTGAASSAPVSPSPTSSTPGSASSAPDAIFGDWHEDNDASTEARQIFVPSSVVLGPAFYRRTLHFGRDGSFSTLRLDPADAHYECPGTFSVAATNELNAECKDPKSGENVKFTIRILAAKKDRLELQITP